MLKRLIWLGMLLTVGCGVLGGGCLSDERRNDHNTSGTITVPRIQSQHDQDGDGILDADDIVAGARSEVTNKTQYIYGDDNNYFSGGYPPDGKGVCTDVIWRAFKEAGYNLKELVDRDIRENLKEYPRVTTPDPNIDFRRVDNLKVFFKRNARTLTSTIIPGDVNNLQEWQGGDLVVFRSPNHIGVVSDQRRSDGVPYLIHNAGPCATEEVIYGTIVGHYRWVQE